jgi:TetR/AcrR family transcriptional regulator, cholesterol catabolism regulator
VGEPPLAARRRRLKVLKGAGRESMQGRPPRRNRHEEVLQAAIEVFHQKGYASASIQDVADSVGVLKGSLYHYIDCKEDLLARIFERSEEQTSAIIGAAEDREVSGVERLERFSRDWSLWNLEHIERASVCSSEWRHLSGRRLQSVMRRRGRFESSVAAMIGDVKAEGEAHPDLDARYAALFLLSAINALSSWYEPDGPDPAEHIAQVYADMIVAMVCHSRGRKSPRTGNRGKTAK